MGYYGIKLNKRVRKIYTIVTPWGLYYYILMPMGIVVARNVFQARLAGICAHILYILVYIDDIAIVGYGTFDKHITDI